MEIIKDYNQLKDHVVAYSSIDYDYTSLLSELNNIMIADYVTESYIINRLQLEGACII